MPRFRVGDSVTVKDSSPDLGSHTGKIIDVSYLSEDLMPCGDPRVYVCSLRMDPSVGSGEMKSNLNND